MDTGSASAKYEVVERGSLYSLNYRLYISKLSQHLGCLTEEFSEGPKGYVSPWHDVPMFADEVNKVYNMVVEIPRWTNAKMEVRCARICSNLRRLLSPKLVESGKINSKKHAMRTK